MNNELREKLAKGFSRVINENSAEHAANTPDYVLGEFLANCFENYCNSVRERDKWYHESRKGMYKNPV